MKSPGDSSRNSLKLMHFSSILTRFEKPIIVQYMVRGDYVFDEKRDS